MKTPNCKSFDFAYETFDGEKRVYCSKRGANVRRGECAKCAEREAKEVRR